MNPGAAVRAGADLSRPLPPLRVGPRMERLRRRVRNLGGLLVSDLVNVRYLTGFRGSAARLVVRAERAALVTDARYAERAADELAVAGADGVDLVIERDLAAQNRAIAALLAGAGPVGLEGDSVTWSQLAAYEELGLELHRTQGLVEGLRRRKDDAELARLARAATIADGALAVCAPLLEEEPTESRFRDALEAAMASAGSEAPSFPTIIAGGPNASRPHHETSARPIRRGEMVICDFGATVDGYHSDMTRTLWCGRPPAAQLALYRAVREAQAAGVAAVASGRPTRLVDEACRDVLRRHRKNKWFVHGTGHGIGLVIHEAPWVGARSTATLAAGDVVTVEPGVYLPGRGGVRIEDSLVVTRSGNIPITNAPKQEP